jgi:hypothetical protein
LKQYVGIAVPAGFTASVDNFPVQRRAYQPGSMPFSLAGKARAEPIISEPMIVMVFIV